MKLDQYITNYLNNVDNVNDKSKIRFFLQQLENDIGKGTSKIPETFALLDKEYMLHSFEEYINQPVTPSKQAAGDYRRSIKTLCKNICTFYNLSNSFLESHNEMTSFDDITKELIDTLKEPKGRSCMSFNDAELIDDEIKQLFLIEDLEYKLTNSIVIQNFKPNYYLKITSAVAIKLASIYGITNKTVATIKINDLNIEEKTLSVNGYKLYIQDELLSYLNIYLQSRKLVLETNNTTSEYLFIKKTAQPYINTNGQSENSLLYDFMQDILGDKNITSLQYKTIIELVSRGANINMLHKLTGVSVTTIAGLSSNEQSTFEDLFYNVNSYPHVQKGLTRRKGAIRCPYCGSYKEASSDNWLLIQISGENIKHLACKECRGLDGEYRY